MKIYKRWRFLAFAAACSLGAGALPSSTQGNAEGVYSSAGGILGQARSQELEQLQLRIGRFASGEAAVYQGEIVVTERPGGPGARRLRRGRVVAALVTHEPSPDRSEAETTLTIVATEDDLWLRLGQSSREPGLTRSSRLRSTRTTTRFAASCTACLDDLAARPQAVRFRRFAAVGMQGAPHRAPVRVEISGRLERVEPADLELSDVEHLNPGFDAFLEGENQPFTRSDDDGARGDGAHGDEAIQRVEREVRTLVEPPVDAPPQMRCERITRYVAERFVDPADLNRFGVRDLSIVGAQTCCLDHGGHGGDEVCTEETAP